MRNIKVNIAGVELNNPVIAASGTFGFGREYGEFYNLDELGAISVKGLTLNPREGNPPPRIAETYGGILNSVGLQNPGVKAFIQYELPELKKHSCKVIANMAGSTFEDYYEMAEILSDSDVDMLEVNISCPNVRSGGVAFGTNAATIYEITKGIKKYAKKPVIIKLSPNVTDIGEMAVAAEQGGADAISLINTLLGMAIDINSRKPILANVKGGFSGPAVKPVAVRMVYEAKNKVKVPIIGMGGITTGDDAVEFMIAGASAVMVGTANFMNPYACRDVKNGILAYMDKYNIEDVNSIVNTVQL